MTECSIRKSQQSPRAGKRRRSAFAKDLSLDDLSTKLAALGEGPEAYAYVIRSMKQANGEFNQTGSAPNFDGGYITLCTCKHLMRTYKQPEEWASGRYWIAGSTAQFGGRNWLAYLMQVGEAYASHFDLVAGFRSRGRQTALDEKYAHLHSLGDILEPKGSAPLTGAQRFSQTRYRAPIDGHPHQKKESYGKDIDYVTRNGRRPSLLVGAASYSFLWTRPVIFRATKRPLPRGNPLSSLGDLLSDLES